MSERLNVALIGSGLMGSFHAASLARRIPRARLIGIADPIEEAAEGLVGRLGLEGVRTVRDYQTLLTDPAVQAVVITTPGATHPEVIAACAEAGKAVFCEKPLGHELEAADRALAAVERAGVPLQLGFQRRFDAGFQRARGLVEDGTLGEVHLLRSITRDPAPPRPDNLRPWVIFFETLIHDFDALRWLAGSEAVEVYAVAANRGLPPSGERGRLDTALVSIRFANGAFATADASFHAAYGYDVRAEVFGSGGMVTVGDGRSDSAWLYGPAGATQPRVHWFADLFGAAYRAELAAFVDCVLDRRPPAVSGRDGRASLAMALAAVESVLSGRPARVAG